MSSRGENLAIFDRLAQQPNLNSETFRKNNVVGKTRRKSHHNEQVNISPCKVDGAFPEQKCGEIKKKFAQEAALQGSKYILLEVKERKSP